MTIGALGFSHNVVRFTTPRAIDFLLTRDRYMMVAEPFATYRSYPEVFLPKATFMKEVTKPMRLCIKKTEL